MRRAPLQAASSDCFSMQLAFDELEPLPEGETCTTCTKCDDLQGRVIELEAEIEAREARILRLEGILERQGIDENRCFA